MMTVLLLLWNIDCYLNMLTKDSMLAFCFPYPSVLTDGLCVDHPSSMFGTICVLIYVTAL